MANLKEIRTRITSVNSTMQITSAMKMVSAAKLKRAQNAVVQMRPYAEKLQEILSNVSSSIDTADNPFVRVREENNVLLVALTSNRGLCGGFNNNVIKKTKKLVSEYGESSVAVFPVGKKANDAFKNSTYLATDNLPQNSASLWDDLNFENVNSLTEELMSSYKNGDFDKIIVVYNSFKNAAVQIIKSEQLLPIVKADSDSENTDNTDYIFEPSQEEIIVDLIPNSLKVTFYKAMLDSLASEHGARMTAMHKATDNASELIKELKLTYNKARQAAITNEILEIVGGAEALNG
ncbi:MAG: ATP synthase F1 subunit gamma [Flavobacteriales bacterium]|mgnify:FL=1|jgi:F-type H+-transporting ATPase subunit gamma|nr:ATP synthase F1 subunit gamma [Flavobacteriales bacterium]